MRPHFPERPRGSCCRRRGLVHRFTRSCTLTGGGGELSIMESEIRSWELVENLIDASVSPERLHELIAVWDSQIERSGLGHVRLANAAGSTFALQVAGVLQLLEQVHAAELRRVND